MAKNITNVRHTVQLSPDCPYHFFFGDESAIVFFTGLKEQACSMHHKYIGVLELPDSVAAEPERSGLLLDIVAPGHQPAEHAVTYLARLERELWELWKGGIFYLAGRYASVHAFSRALLERGVQPAQLKFCSVQIAR